MAIEIQTVHVPTHLMTKDTSVALLNYKTKVEQTLAISFLINSNTYDLNVILNLDRVESVTFTEISHAKISTYFNNETISEMGAQPK
ncbi:hypothetical protein D5R81_19575 [Parashewanella spongiae]|uniref:Uncharacterized protein n=1 Tax=Parashewanella spongiae TaxID=342950 RepID=A0A3A6TLH2_9GAMM|nr:hypothetical protein [Parashewanella spongiae]MCL1080221.1 hypothetical protein [Parashewanella spongiae]RJY02113.1 hypothetical protein D5R81_19575 [Parashewanella spongiae]